MGLGTRVDLREALLFSRFCNFLLKTVLDLPVQSSFMSRISERWGMGRISIFGSCWIGSPVSDRVAIGLW